MMKNTKTGIRKEGYFDSVGHTCSLDSGYRYLGATFQWQVFTLSLVS